MAYKKRKTLASITRGPRRPVFPFVVTFLVLCIIVGFAVGYLIDKSQTSGDNSVVFDGEQVSAETLSPEYTNPPSPEATPAIGVGIPDIPASPEYSATPLPSGEAEPYSPVLEEYNKNHSAIGLLPADTDLETLAPVLANKYLPDYDTIEVEEPVTFSADKLEGTRVILENIGEYCEIYFAEVPAGIITFAYKDAKPSGVPAHYTVRTYLETLRLLELI
ncbi:MAG: hypothetical protein LBM98_10365 [Oscillospiraceae bacterium]|jgi:hypothetical protein|nr:hypothetical protein [Oscillospiraceae bacterium]